MDGNSQKLFLFSEVRNKQMTLFFYCSSVTKPDF